jgi:non-heme chloroperoxidase
VLVASVTPSDGVDPANFNGLRAGIAADRPQSFSNFFRNRFFMGADPLVSKVSEGALTWTLSLALQASLKATLDTIGAFSENLRSDLKAFTMPTMIIHGDADAVAPIDMTGRPTAKMIPKSRLEVYEGAPRSAPAGRLASGSGAVVAHPSTLADIERIRNSRSTGVRQPR